MKNLKISYEFINISEQLKKSVKDRVELNLKNKMDSYFKKVAANKPDAEIKLHICLEEKQGRFEGKLISRIDGQGIEYKRFFDNPQELINHAFNHLKLFLTEKKTRLKKNIAYAKRRAK